MGERKFKENDYVVVKPWEQLIEEFGMVDPEVVRQKMRDDEDCYWSEEEIDAYNPEIVDVPWGARKQMIDELEEIGLMKVKGYGEHGEVELESDTYIDSIVSEEILTPVNEEDVKKYIFWMNKSDNDFDGIRNFAFTEDLLRGVGGYDDAIQFLDKKENQDVLPYFFAASILRSENFEDGVTEFLEGKHDVSVYIDRLGNSNDSSQLNLKISNISKGEMDTYVSDWNGLDWVEISNPEEHLLSAYKILLHKKNKGIFIACEGNPDDHKKDFDFYIHLMETISFVHGNTMDDVLELVKNRDRSAVMEAIKGIFKEKDEQYKKIQSKINIENFLKVASKSQERQLRHVVDSKKSKASEYAIAYSNVLNELKEAQERLFGYLYMNDDSELDEVRSMLNMLGDDLRDFHCDSDGQWFSFVIIQPLLYWDDDVYERLENNEYFEDRWGHRTKSVMDKVFKTREYTVYLNQAIQIDLENNAPRALRDYDYLSEGFEYIPNPHLNSYNCWGDNEPNIRQAISNRDYIELFNLIRSTVAGIALYDSEVMARFVEYAVDVEYDFYKQKCIKVKGKDEMISFKEALDMED